MAKLYQNKYSWECPYIIGKHRTVCSMDKNNCDSADITECSKLARILSQDRPKPDMHDHELETIGDEHGRA